MIQGVNSNISTYTASYPDPAKIRQYVNELIALRDKTLKVEIDLEDKIYELKYELSKATNPLEKVKIAKALSKIQVELDKVKPKCDSIYNKATAYVVLLNHPTEKDMAEVAAFLKENNYPTSS